MATGTYGFPKELGIQIAVDTFTDFLEANDIDITLAVFGNGDVTIFGKLVEDIENGVKNINDINLVVAWEAGKTTRITIL